MFALDQSDVLRRFDELVAKGELQYAEPTVTHLDDDGFLLEICVTKVFAAKPQLGEPGTLQTKSQPARATDSDIDHADPAFHIADVNSTHKLILNKYCVFRPQYLLLTRDPTAQQSAPLDADDFAAAWTVLSGAPPGIRYWIMFNCGRAGGSSRKHKHMQVFEAPVAPSNGGGRHTNVQLGNTTPLLGDRPDDLVHAPFQLYYEKLGMEMDAATAGLRLAEIQEKHMALCREAVGKFTEASEAEEDGNSGNDDPRPHNTLLTTDWIMTIPRRVATVEDMSPVSAAGMIGRVWLTGDDQLAKWIALRPRHVLESVGVPRS